MQKTVKTILAAVILTIVISICITCAVIYLSVKSHTEDLSNKIKNEIFMGVEIPKSWVFLKESTGESNTEKNTYIVRRKKENSFFIQIDSVAKVDEPYILNVINSNRFNVYNAKEFKKYQDGKLKNTNVRFVRYVRKNRKKGYWNIFDIFIINKSKKTYLISYMKFTSDKNILIDRSIMGFAKTIAKNNQKDAGSGRE